MDDEAVQRNTEQVTKQVKNLIQELDSDMDRCLHGRWHIEHTQNGKC